MKVPTEADLIEVENLVLKPWQIDAEDGGNKPYRIVRTLEYLIAQQRAKLPPVPPMPPRRPAPKLSVVVQPKKKKR
jgi:hypothetical protein